VNNLIFDKMVIECSPFIRCMQSAARIAHLMCHKEVIINYTAIDHLD